MRRRPRPGCALAARAHPRSARRAPDTVVALGVTTVEQAIHVIFEGGALAPAPDTQREDALLPEEFKQDEFIQQQQRALERLERAACPSRTAPPASFPPTPTPTPTPTRLSTTCPAGPGGAPANRSPGGCRPRGFSARHRESVWSPACCSHLL